MRMLIISPSFYPSAYYGGPIYATYELAKAIKEQNIDIKVVTTNCDGKDRLKIKTGIYHRLDKDLPVIYYHSLDSRGISISMFLNLWKVIKVADLIYLISIFSPSTPLTILFCALQKKPIIILPNGQLGKWSLNQGNSFKKIWLNIFIKTFLKSLAWHLTSVEEQKDVKNIYPSAKTFVIPIGITTSNLGNKVQKKDKLFYIKYSELVKENSRVIISMGRLQKVKGFDILISTVKKVKEQFKDNDVVLFIAGEDFGEKEKLLDQIKELKLDSSVFLIGHIAGEEKINFLKNADVFALPSHHENFGMVYGEALSSGTPIVASKNTPWKEIEKYNCGKWVKNTPDKFAEAIMEILNSDNVQMGVNGSKYIEDNFSWDKIAINFKKQIETIVIQK